MDNTRSDEAKALNRMRAVTISREYGSGGGEIAGRLARRLGWHLVDHEAVIRMAQDLGVSEEEAEAHDERTEGVLASFLRTVQGMEPSLYANAPEEAFTNMQDYHAAMRRILAAAIREGHVVIVGRGSQVALRERRDVLHARIVASTEQRVPYIMRREGVDEGTARKRISTKDHDRQRYLQANYNHEPADAHLYDLTINTDVLDLDAATDLIYVALHHKATRLTLPPEELGPGAGLTRYPASPEDFSQMSQPE
jgi:cytidylate kinase